MEVRITLEQKADLDRILDEEFDSAARPRSRADSALLEPRVVLTVEPPDGSAQTIRPELSAAQLHATAESSTGTQTGLLQRVTNRIKSWLGS